MFCRQALRTVNQIRCRTTLNHLNRSTSLLFFDYQKFPNKQIHQTNQLQKNELFWQNVDDILYSLKTFTYSGSNLQCASVALLQAAIDQVDYSKWFEYFEMQDTISSWYQITMLHVWMILVRISEPDKESEFFKQQVIKRMWEDLAVRMRKLGNFPAKEKNNFINDCSLSFNAALIAYDEGLVGSDRELAASLWRTFFAYECVDYTKLELLVDYTRLQIKHLANIKNDRIRSEAPIEWKKFDFPK